MNTYIGKITYTILPYGSEEKPEEISAIHLIKADTPEEAKEKLRQHYIDKTKNYCYYYDVIHTEIFSCIE